MKNKYSKRLETLGQSTETPDILALQISDFSWMQLAVSFQMFCFLKGFQTRIMLTVIRAKI